MKRVLAILVPTVFAAACALEIEDARFAVRKDLSSSAHVLISRPVATDEIGDTAHEEARKWARRVRTCGGSHRQVFDVSDKVLVESRFELEGDRDRDLLLLCIADKDKHQPRVQISKDERFFVDRYTLDLSFEVPWDIDLGGKVDLLPNKISLEMPGAIVRHSDSSYLPFDRATWRREGRGRVVVNIQPVADRDAARRIQALGRSLGPNPSEAEVQAAMKRLDSRLRMTIVSEERRFSTLEIASAILTLAAAPFIPWLGRWAVNWYRRVRKPKRPSGAD